MSDPTNNPPPNPAPEHVARWWAGGISCGHDLERVFDAHRAEGRSCVAVVPTSTGTWIVFGPPAPSTAAPTTTKPKAKASR